MLGALATVAVVAAGAPPASLSADLDGDGHKERVRFAAVQCAPRSNAVHKPPCRTRQLA